MKQSLLVTSLLWMVSIAAAQQNWNAQGQNGAVAAGKTGSAEAGLAMLQKGGNAMDAAAASILALSVTDHSDFCFGSEVPIIVYDARRQVVETLSGMGAAPRLASQEYFALAGVINREIPENAAVPAALDAILTLLERYGTMRFTDIAEPALALLDQHQQPWHERLARTLRRLTEAEAQAKDRRQGLRLVSDYFYRGPIAWEIDAWARASGSLIRYPDLATHATRVEAPVTANYRGYTIYKCGPWTQGPYLLQSLRLLEGFDLKKSGFQTAPTIHLIVEAMKLALADRDTYYGDPLFVKTPLRELLADNYTQMRRKLIDSDKASLEQRPGDPINGKPLLAPQAACFGLSGKVDDTTTCLAADKWGNVVAATPSGWQGREVAGTGIWLGSRLISFNVWKGHPNCIEPGKRPRITLTPTIVFKDGKPAIAVSVAGGDTQDQATLQMLTNYIDFGLPADKLVRTPRYHTDQYTGSFCQTPPLLGRLNIEKEMGADVIARLKKMGHDVPGGPVPFLRICITFDPATGALHAAGDPNCNRHAFAF